MSLAALIAAALFAVLTTPREYGTTGDGNA